MAPTTTRDYYELLGVPDNATHHEIQTAYGYLRQKFQCEVYNGTKHALEQLNLVIAAYEVLRDTNRRADYDRTPWWSRCPPTKWVVDSAHAILCICRITEARNVKKYKKIYLIDECKHTFYTIDIAFAECVHCKVLHPSSVWECDICASLVCDSCALWLQKDDLVYGIIVDEVDTDSETESETDELDSESDSDQDSDYDPSDSDEDSDCESVDSLPEDQKVVAIVQGNSEKVNVVKQVHSRHSLLSLDFNHKMAVLMTLNVVLILIAVLLIVQLRGYRQDDLVGILDWIIPRSWTQKLHRPETRGMESGGRRNLARYGHHY